MADTEEDFYKEPTPKEWAGFWTLVAVQAQNAFNEKAVQFLLIPLGFGVWQLAAAAVTGFIAKENVVGTLAVCYALTRFIDTEEFALVGGANEVAVAMGLTKVAALAYLMFNLFTPPCFAALGAMNSEMQDKKWLWGGIALQFGTGYTVAFLVYQIGTLITAGTVGTGFVPGLIAVAAIVGFVVYIIKKERIYVLSFLVLAVKCANIICFFD